MIHLILTPVYSSPWRNAYWFTRNLLNTDQFGALGKDERLMREILTDTKAVILQSLTEEDKLKVCMDITCEKMGQQQQIFYLTDDSPRYLSAKDHIGMEKYVRPLSRLIDDFAKEQGIKVTKK